MKPEQCKAARELLGWKQLDLAQKAKLGISTVADFERGTRNLMPNNMKAIVETFKKEEIFFVTGIMYKDKFLVKIET